jgi:hypothetical protein
MSTYSAKIAAARCCRFCAASYLIEPDVWLTGTMEELQSSIPEAVVDQQEEDGWVAGACPLCAFARSEELHAEAHADDYRDDWEGGNAP